MIVITSPARSAARCSATCSIAANSSGSSPAIGQRSRPRCARTFDIVEGSHGDAAVVDEAFAGADAVFWLTPPDPQAPSVDAGRGAPWAAWAGFVAGSLPMDDLIAASGVAYRALANPYFMEDTVHQAESIKNQGMFFSPIAGDRKLPAVATRDIAAAASRLLLDASWSGAGEVPLLGPEDLSFNDMAGIMSQVLGKDVRIRQITFEAYKTHTRAGHMPASKTSEPHARRVALVTGAAHGIGQAIAAGLAERATRIVLGAIDDVSESSDLTGRRRALHTVMSATKEDGGATGKGAVGGE